MKKFYFTSIAVEVGRQRETLDGALTEAISLTEKDQKDRYVWELKRIVRVAKPPILVEKVK